MKNLTLAAAAVALAVSSAPVLAARMAVYDSAIHISGEITSRDWNAISGIVEVNTAHPITRIYIDSPGGDSFGSLALARAVRESGLPLQVVNECNSGCAYVYLAARNARSPVRVLGHGTTGSDREKEEFLGAVGEFLDEIGYPEYYDDVVGSTMGTGKKVFTVRRK